MGRGRPRKVENLFSDRSNIQFSEGQKSKGILDDFALRKVIDTQEGTIQKTPTNNKDIVNKEYCDGNLSPPGGNDTEIQFNDNGSFAGDANLTWNGSELELTGDFIQTGDAEITGYLYASDVESGGDYYTGLTAGSVVFVGSGKLTEDNDNFFWDDTNNRLGIGTKTPNNKLQIKDFFEYNDTSYYVHMGTNAGLYPSTTSGTHNVFIGYEAGKGTASTTGATFNVGIGYQSLKSVTTGDRNVGIGASTLATANTGKDNFALGAYALTSCTDGEKNVAIGYNTLYFLTGGYNNVAIGVNAGYLARNNNNIFIGTSAGYQYGTSTNYNTIIGNLASYTATSGASNVIIGYKAGYRQTSPSNLLIIDNQDRSTLANEATNCLIYGAFNSTVSSQTLTINGQLYFNGGDGTGLPYGSCYGNEIAWSQAAAQNTWYNISDSDMADGQLLNVTHDGNGKLTVGKAGRYLINYSATVQSGTANTYIELGIEVSASGSAENAGQAHTDSVTANKYLSCSGTAILDLAANATVEVAVRTTDAGNPTITVDDLNITVLQVGGT